MTTRVLLAGATGMLGNRNTYALFQDIAVSVRLHVRSAVPDAHVRA